MSEKDKTDKKFEEMYSYLLNQAGPEASYGGGYEMPYDAEGGHTKEEADEEYAKLFRELHGIPEEEDILEAKKNKVSVIGHINPDTDSIVSAMAYAELKNHLDPTAHYIPCRAGKINEETWFVLDSLDVEVPELMTAAISQISDIRIRDLEGVPDSITLSWAWELLKEKSIVTLPITERLANDQDSGVERETLKGLITVKDIGHIYMDAIESDLISKAKTPYENIRAALDGKLIVDNDRHIVDRGKVVVAAGEPETITEYVEDGDVVIASNRVESQIAAINAGAGLIIITVGTRAEDRIIALAREKGCAVISTGYDTYNTARLVNQSVPVSYAMIKDNLVTFRISDRLDYVKKVMSREKHRDFPVLDEDGYYIGMISRRYLVDADRKKVILVDHNEKSQAIDNIGEADILEIIDHHRLSSVETMHPVFFRNEPVGSTSTIVYEMYRENGVEIDKINATLLCAGILSDTLMFKSPTTSQQDKMAAIDLAGIAGIDMVSYASEMFRAGSRTDDISSEELLRRDFKKFTIDDTNIGIGQFISMDADELASVKEELLTLLGEERKNRELDMVFFMLTDIVKTRSEVLFEGPGAQHTLEEAFDVIVDGDSALIDGLISRKKQMVPEIIGAMQQ